MKESLVTINADLALEITSSPSFIKEISTKIVEKDFKNEVITYINSVVDVNSEHVKMLDSTKTNNIEEINKNVHCLVNLAKINDARYVDALLQSINSKIHKNGMYIGCVETSEERKERIFKKYPKFYAFPFYVGTFLMKRFAPKWKPTQKLYFFLTKGKNRYFSLAEVLGRLVANGFSIYDYKEIGHLTYYVVKKISAPITNQKPSKGIFIRLKRIGVDGGLINVYKFRTMHPYAEYIQGYVYENNNLKEGGKFMDDFRITTIGKTFRKLWIDELPMIINVLKGDLKLVGVRPLSQHYLSLYNINLLELRHQVKPGLLPPFYADMPKTLEEIMASEEKYLLAYKKAPFRTDMKYLRMILKNILLKSARSG